MAQQADGTIYIDTLLDTTGFKAGGKEVEAAVRRMTQTVSGIGATAKAALQKQVDSFVKANQAYAKQEQKVESLKNKLKELKDQKVETDEFKEIGKQIDNDTAKLNRLEKAQEEFLAVGGKESSSAYRRREMEIEELRNSIKYAKGEQEELLNTGGAYRSVDTSGAEQQVIAAEQRLQQMNNSLATSFESLRARVQSYGGAADDLTRIKQRLAQVFSSFAASAKKTATAVGKTLLTGLKKTGKAMQSLVSGAKQAASALLHLHKNTGKSNKSIGISLKSLMRYGLGIRSVFALVNRLRSALVEGFRNLAQYDNRTNASISSLKASLTQLKNSFATAFAPILNVVAPILKTFINMISRAVTYVGMLIAALTGQGSFVRAKEVQEDYAGSLGDTAKGYKDASKAQKGYLSGLDEVHRWESADSGSQDSGSAGAGGGAGSGDMFERVPIDSGLRNLAEKLKEMWKNADFTDLGSAIGEKIRDALDRIPWDTIKQTAGKVGKSIATFLNGGIEVPGFAESIGKTVGEAINTALSFASNFINNFHFDSLGNFIANGMNSAIATISWGGIGETVRNGLNGVFEAVKTWSARFDFTSLGTAIKDLINSALTKIKWKDAITSASNIGKGIADAINEFITPETFGNIGKTIANAVNTVVSGLFSFLDTTNFEQLAQSVAQAINDFIGKTDWNKVGQTIGTGLQAAIDFVSTLIASIKWEDVVQALQDFWQGICEKVDMGEVGKILLTALGAWLTANAVISLGSSLLQVGTAAVGGIIKAILSAISTAAFSPVGLAIAGAITAGVLIVKNWDKIKAAAGRLKDWVVDRFEDIKKGIGKAWDSVKTKTSEIWNGIKSTLSTAWNGIKTNATNMFSNIKNAVSTAWDNIKSKTSGIWNGIKTSLSTTWSNLKNSAATAFDNVKTTVSSAWDSLKEKTSTIWNGIKSALSTSWDNLKSYASTKFGNIKTSIVNAWDNIKTSTSNIWSNIKTVFSNKASSLLSTAKTLGTNLKNTFSNAFSNICNMASSMFSKVGSFLSGVWNNIKSKASSIATSVGNMVSGRRISVGYSYPVIQAPVTPITAKIPYLATGAVIPPNAPFVAVLGDQKRGTNVEAPLSTIEQAVANALKKNGSIAQNATIRIPVILDGRQLFEAVIDEAKMKQMVSGRNPFEMSY